MRLRFDNHGHILISPRQFLEAAKKDIYRLASDVLCHGTPALCNTYNSYRTFIHKTADALRVSPFSIWIRGSAHVGFSIAPRAGKVWMGVNDGSDIDLAIVDPDHYHRLDVEIRHWARTEPPGDYSRRKNLGQNRQYYCYRHDDLPTTPTCHEYKETIEIIKADIKRTVTAFFYRDYWALHERCMKDIRDLLSQDRLGLPRPGLQRRPATWLKNGDLNATLCRGGQTELNLARKDSDYRFEITDEGLAALDGLGTIERVWLDSCGVGDLGIKTLRGSDRVTFLSLTDTPITDASFELIAAQFPKLQVLVLDKTNVTAEAAMKFCGGSLVNAISVRYCNWPKAKELRFRNANNAPVAILGW